MKVYKDIIKEREEKIAQLEQELRDKDIELLDMYKDLEYFKGKLTMPKGW